MTAMQQRLDFGQYSYVKVLEVLGFDVLDLWSFAVTLPFPMNLISKS